MLVKLLRFSVFYFLLAFVNAGNLYLQPSFDYGVTVIDSAAIPATLYSLGLLYQPESSPFVIGIKVGYENNTSNNYYLPANNYQGFYTKTMTGTYEALSAGAIIPMGRHFTNILLFNINTVFGGTYSVGCGGNPGTSCAPSNNLFNSWGVGIENQMLYDITNSLSFGIDLGVTLSQTTVSNYQEPNGTSINSSQNLSAALPYLGIILSYKCF